MPNGDGSSAPPMSESLGMPAGLAGMPASVTSGPTPMPAPRVPTDVQNQNAPLPQQYDPSTQQEPPTHHHALAGVLAAIAGPPPPVHQINAQTGQMQTLPGKDSPGDAFRRILSGALIGMGAGAAAGAQGHPGAGILGGIGAGGTAVMNRQQALNQQDIENQEKQFQQQQTAKLNQATMAHLAAETASTTWQAVRWQAEISEKQAEKINELSSMVASDPSNKDYGSYASFDEFLQKHKEIVPDIANLQAQGKIQTIPEFSADGKVKTLHVYEISPQWADQTNEKPESFSIDMGMGKTQDITVPAHGMKNVDILKTRVVLAEKSMQAGLAKTDQGRHIQMYLQANNLPDTAANRLKGENDYIEKTRIAPAQVRVEGMGATRGVSMLDTKNNNAPVEMTWNDINAANKNEPGRYIPSTVGEKALKQTALVEDIRGGLNQVRQDLQDEKMPEFTAAQRAQLAIAMGGTDPRTALSAALRGGVIGNLTDEQQTYLNDLLSLTENAMAMRSMLGAGQGSEDLRTAIRQTLPGSTTPSKKMALQKLDNLEKTLGRLQRGIPQVQLGGGGGTQPTAGGQGAGAVNPTPATHVFHKSAYSGKDVEAAAKQAAAQGYEVQP